MADNMFNVKGLDKFADYFTEFSDNYIIVGGTACSVAMGDVGLSFRATKDIDMIITVEEISYAFGERFWQFVHDGGYDIYQNKEGVSQFFRFQNPKNGEFPAMIELFSRKQDIFHGDRHSTFIPIVIDEEISSLSAILLDDNYYAFLKSGRELVKGLSLLKPSHLIAFKARAYIDLVKRKAEGLKVNTSDIKKHKNDIYRLVQLLTEGEFIDVPVTVKADMNAFFKHMKDEEINIKALGLPVSQYEAEEIIRGLFKI